MIILFCFAIANPVLQFLYDAKLLDHLSEIITFKPIKFLKVSEYLEAIYNLPYTKVVIQMVQFLSYSGVVDL